MYNGADAGEGINHDADESPIAQTDDRIYLIESKGLQAWSLVSTGVLPRSAACFGPAGTMVDGRGSSIVLAWVPNQDTNGGFPQRP